MPPSLVIIELVFRRVSLVCLQLLLLFTGCTSGDRTKEKIQAAIIDRLQTRSGLDLKTLDVSTTNVSFDKNMAYATVAFHPKGEMDVKSGMMMKYTLEDRDGKWVVVNVGDSQGHSMPGHPSGSGGSLPAGHPPLKGQMAGPAGGPAQ